MSRYDPCEDLMDEGEDSDINLIADCSKVSFEEIRRDLLIEKEAMKPFGRFNKLAISPKVVELAILERY